MLEEYIKNKQNSGLITHLSEKNKKIINSFKWNNDFEKIENLYRLYQKISDQNFFESNLLTGYESIPKQYCQIVIGYIIHSKSFSEYKMVCKSLICPYKGTQELVNKKKVVELKVNLSKQGLIEHFNAPINYTKKIQKYNLNDNLSVKRGLMNEKIHQKINEYNNKVEFLEDIILQK